MINFLTTTPHNNIYFTNMSPPPLPDESSLPPLPSVTGTSTRHISILLVNPNSTASMTATCLKSLEPTLPPNVTVYGFTAPHPAPSAIEGQLDAIISTAASIRAIIPIAHHYDAFLVACYSAHPLIPALREELPQPTLGIMEATLYASRLLGTRLSIVTTSPRSALIHADTISALGLAPFSVGCAAANVSVLGLERLPADRVLALMGDAARRLKERGADCVCLGCAGMVGMRGACEDAARGDGEVQIVDGVGVGVQMLVALVREGLGTAKAGAYRSSRETREARGQDWL